MKLSKLEEGKWKYELNTLGKKFFKGANKPIMRKLLKKSFKTKKRAEYYLTTTLGSSSRPFYKLKEV